jgi:hypothetical protein
MREMLTDNRRDCIRLLYDRYGNTVSITQETTEIDDPVEINGVARILATPLQPQPISRQDVAITTDSRGVARILRGSDCRGVASFLLPSPISPIEVEEDDVVGGALKKLATPLQTSQPSVPPEIDTTTPSLPKTSDDVIAWLAAVTDDLAETKRLKKKIPLWVHRIQARCPMHSAVAAEWVQDALIIAADKPDVVRYAEKVLANWVEQGGRPSVEIPSPRRALPEPDPATDIGVPVIYDRTKPVPAKPSYGQRVNAERKRLLDSFANVKFGMEDGHAGQ